jgi:AhpD family alkylhydroperoxidase
MPKPTETDLTQRLSLTKPNEGVNAMHTVEAWLGNSLDRKLLAIVKLRASQINGCTYCLHMHSEEALKLGERLERLILLDAWRESKLYTERERAALNWTEVLTRIVETRAPDSDFEKARRHFNENELIALSIASRKVDPIADDARSPHRTHRLFPLGQSGERVD